MVFAAVAALAPYLTEAAAANRRPTKTAADRRSTKTVRAPSTGPQRVPADVDLERLRSAAQTFSGLAEREPYKKGVGGQGPTFRAQR